MRSQKEKPQNPFSCHHYLLSMKKMTSAHLIPGYYHLCIQRSPGYQEIIKKINSFMQIQHMQEGSKDVAGSRKRNSVGRICNSLAALLLLSSGKLRPSFSLL